jgi:cytochrome c oxidase accessory protein FixG
VRIGGHPAVQLNVEDRRFYLFGGVFNATDVWLVVFALMAFAFGLLFMTAWLGRAWCGWACPQTVYMEFLFRPIERLFEGPRENQLRLDRSGGGVRRFAKNVVFLLVSAVLANIFLAYFVGVKTLIGWTRLSPLEHWTPFLVAAATTALVFFDFAFFREQMCTVACPYARIQSVLLDKSSLIVGYDRLRGEPRGKGKPQPGRGDCIDCDACVAACPTGIDIRDGLQLECIACAQCADACDTIMLKVKKPLGLIRYGSQTTLETQQPTRILRPRVVIYPVLLAALLVALVVFGGSRTPAEVTVLRGIGAPFVVDGREVTSELRIKVQNRTDESASYRIELVGTPGVRLIAPENPLEVAPGAQRTTAVFAVAPRAEFKAGQREIVVRVSDAHVFQTTVPYRLLGPTEETKP